MTISYLRHTDKVLTVTTKSGYRRTLQIAQIVDLVEVENGQTEVIYRAGQHIIVPMPFDELLACWTGANDITEWLGA